jgi:hypothetical protein
MSTQMRQQVSPPYTVEVEDVSRTTPTTVVFRVDGEDNARCENNCRDLFTYTDNGETVISTFVWKGSRTFAFDAPINQLLVGENAEHVTIRLNGQPVGPQEVISQTGGTPPGATTPADPSAGMAVAALAVLAGVAYVFLG